MHHVSPTPIFLCWLVPCLCGVGFVMVSWKSPRLRLGLGLLMSDDVLIMIVVGSSLHAEVGDRPVAYRLAQRIDDHLGQIGLKQGGLKQGGLKQGGLKQVGLKQGGLKQVGVKQIAQKQGDCVRCMVCTDLWYLNDAPLRRCPTIALGGPDRNALTAYLRDKVPSAFAIDGSLLVQVDLTYGQLDACCWGADDAMTARAVDAFCERYLPQFVDAAASRLA